MAKPILYPIGNMDSVDIIAALDELRSKYSLYLKAMQTEAEDLAFLEAWCCDIVIPYKTCPSKEYRNPDWVCWEFHHIKSCEECPYFHKFQPKVVAVVLESGKKTVELVLELLDQSYTEKGILDEIEDQELSIGVAKETLFCVTHHILLIDMTTALTKPYNEWKHYKTGEENE